MSWNDKSGHAENLFTDTSSLSILKKHLKSQIGHAEKPLWDQMWPAIAAKGFSAWPVCAFFISEMSEMT